MVVSCQHFGTTYRSHLQGTFTLSCWFFYILYIIMCRSQWPRGLRRRSAATHLLRSWVWIPPGAWMFVCCECCVLSGRGLCDELIGHPEESYRLWCIVVCYLETSRMRRPWPVLGRSTTAKKKKKIFIYIYIYIYIYIIMYCTDFCLFVSVLVF